MDKITIENLVEYQKQLESNKITQEEYNKKFAEYVEQQKKASERVSNLTAENIALYQSEVRLNEILGDTLAAYDANNRALKEAEALLEQVKSKTDGLTDAEAELIFKQYGTVEAIKAAIEALKAKKKSVDDLGPAYKDALNKSKPFFQDIATKMKVFSKEGNNFVKKMGEFGSFATQPGGLSGLAKGFTEVFNPLNFGVSVITQIVKATKDMIFAVDSAGAAFTRTTGFTRNFDGLIASTNERMRQFGVSAEDSSKAIIGLRQGLSQFDALSTSTQEKLTDLVTGLEKIGFAGADAVAVISSLNKAFGVSVDVAADITRELAMSGDAIGRTTSQISRDYVKSLSTLAVYGDRSVDVFKNIATMAAAAGVEVDTLVGIANKFDTFSDAASTAAKINAILGTSFSGLNLQMMDHDKRVKTVITGLRSTGIAFRNLDKFTQQAIATQLGIQDLEKANRILGMSVGEFTRLQQKQAAAAKSQEAMNEKMNKAMDVIDKLKVIMADFAINLEKTGMIPKIQSLVEGFGSLIQKITPMGLLITGLSSMFVGFAINTAGLVAKIKLVEKFGGSAIEGISNSIAKGLNIVAKASQTSSPALGKLSISLGGIALVIATVAVSVALITFSLAYLFNTMIQGIVTLKKVGAGFAEVAFGIGAMVGSVYALAGAVKVSIKPQRVVREK